MNIDKLLTDITQLSQGNYYIYVETNTETLLVAYVELQWQCWSIKQNLFINQLNFKHHETKHIK